MKIGHSEINLWSMWDKFVVPFSYRSCSLALKLSLKSHQMKTCFVQNDKSFHSNEDDFALYVMNKNVVIWKNESKRKKEPEISHLNELCSSQTGAKCPSFCNMP